VNWPNYLSAAGTTIEFIGFLILATELIQTNKGSVREAKELAAVKMTLLGR